MPETHRFGYFFKLPEYQPVSKPVICLTERVAGLILNELLSMFAMEAIHVFVIIDPWNYFQVIAFHKVRNMDGQKFRIKSSADLKILTEIY